MRLCDFGSCVTGHIFVRNVEEKAAAEEIIGKETTPMYRSPEMIDLYMRDILTEKTDIWVRYWIGVLDVDFNLQYVFYEHCMKNVAGSSSVSFPFPLT